MSRTPAINLVSALLIAMALVSGCGGGADEPTNGGSSGEPAANGFEPGAGSWPHFGRIDQRTHYLPAGEELNPPLKQEWSFSDRVLIEYPPALDDGVAYLADKYGDVRALRLSDRSVIWDLMKDDRYVGPPSDTTGPAYFDDRVFVAFQSGILIALDADSGKITWKRDMHTGLQSSPIVVGGKLYLGSETGVMYCLEAGSGKTVWTYQAGSPVKSSPSLDGGSVYFANYEGSVFAADADSGKLKWRTDTTRTEPGGSGGFYSSPALAGGRVYIGRDDGTVYVFDQKDGRQAWFFETGDDVYGSPAVAKVPGTPLTVYIGSYDGKLYALNAATGKKEWDFNVGGQVPGTATVIGDTVYTSSFQTKESIGIDIKSHRKVFSFDSPGYTPMISDGKNLYLIGYFTLHGFVPR